MCQLTFAGVMLFERSGDELSRVLLPDAEFVTPKEGDHDSVYDTSTHLDGFRAARHYPRLVVERSGKRKLYSLQYTRLTIGSHDTGESLWPEWRLLAKLSDYGLVPDATGYSCEVNLTGAFRVRARESTQFRFRDQWITDRVEAEASQVALTLTRAVGELTIDLDAQDKAWVLSSDVPLPSGNLDKKVKVSKGHIDHDFKWLYSLLQPADSGTLKEWMMTRGFDQLPAPMYTGDRAASVSTCFPGWL